MLEILTPARLHLGLLDTNGNLGRLYGSIGVAIQQPNVILRAAPAASLQVHGLESDRVTAFARRFLAYHKLDLGARLELVAAIPGHVGLGSGTQLALALGAALAHLAGLDLSVAEIARSMGRGVHSGIGTNTFAQGGFVLDGGHSTLPAPPGAQKQAAVPPVLVRQPFPEDWRFVVVIPEIDPGLSGEKETNAFQELPKAPPSRVARMCRLLVMQMLPALFEQNIVEFGHALTQIQRLVGASFAPIQGGQFADPLSDRLIAFLLDHGAAGAGQSSWGPTVYGLVASQPAADLLAARASIFLATLRKGQVFTVAPDNHGARII
ncbi:MAG TPA: beta-ribofuranosylaminobenzene 5'-phosphate synthase family protein [Anaerolineales bacterium]|nr:beta-ribofuranosylaminobenzene 5'-phosphate synthase family protein [Anaerolineales bacterium]